MQRHVPDEVSLVPEGLSALRALVGLLLGGGGNVVRVVVQVLVPLQELLLPEALVALVALTIRKKEEEMEKGVTFL